MLLVELLGVEPIVVEQRVAWVHAQRSGHRRGDSGVLGRRSIVSSGGGLEAGRLLCGSLSLSLASHLCCPFGSCDPSRSVRACPALPGLDALLPVDLVDGPPVDLLSVPSRLLLLGSSSRGTAGEAELARPRSHDGPEDGAA